MSARVEFLSILGLIVLWILAGINGYRSGVAELNAANSNHVAPIARLAPKKAKPEFPQQEWQTLDKA